MGNVCDSYCEGCAYMGRIHASLRICDYIFIVGKCRPCPAGTGCTAKITDKEARRRIKAERRAEEIERKRKEKLEKNRLYRQRKKAEKVKFCRRCGKPFTPSADQRLYCCAECATAQEAENRKKWDAQKWQKRKAAMKAAKQQQQTPTGDANK